MLVTKVDELTINIKDMTILSLSMCFSANLYTYKRITQ